MMSDSGDVGEALRKMVAVGILEVVDDTGDPLSTTYRMPDPDGVKAALDELKIVRLLEEE
jgi:hypothetical protein